MAQIEITTKPPAAASASELEEFVALVREGGEVADGLNNRVLTAHALVFAKTDGRSIAVAAVKKPAYSYRARVFKKSQVPERSGSFGYELGWIFVSNNHRGIGLSHSLVSVALKSIDGAPIFATTRSDNNSMKHVLTKAGFVICGDEYPSSQNVGAKLNLFVSE